MTLNGGSVTTTGLGAQGLFASGAGSQIPASGMDVSTGAEAGTFVHAVLAYQGGQITITDGSATTASNSSYVVQVLSAGAVSVRNDAVGDRRRLRRPSH